MPVPSAVTAIAEREPADDVRAAVRPAGDVVELPSERSAASVIIEKAITARRTWIAPGAVPAGRTDQVGRIPADRHAREAERDELDEHLRRHRGDAVSSASARKIPAAPSSAACAAVQQRRTGRRRTRSPRCGAACSRSAARGARRDTRGTRPRRPQTPPREASSRERVSQDGIRSTDAPQRLPRAGRSRVAPRRRRADQGRPRPRQRRARTAEHVRRARRPRRGRRPRGRAAAARATCCSTSRPASSRPRATRSGRRTVVELVPNEPRVVPVGRLDADTTGALLLTNDGPLAHRLAHPRYEVEKVYEAEVDGDPSDDALRAAARRRRARRRPHRARGRAPPRPQPDRARPARGPQPPGEADVRGGRPPASAACTAACTPG